ncbi:Golgi apyrase; AltName: Full=ATP-diphosphatase; AltName: Full=ATP-diphosphohydrolase; AltName: Full=Adenosine diphosphatase; Short=ADPase; AltName: Full=Golgi nucleoside diphosphatase; AltName: Full=Yeast nucleoside diphosphatase 1 [Serendipita indica DSM 11827]|uniref:Related to YND1-apyrase (NDPase/NTPase) n=1 Tax=Serendipita indica (strain DSM 11827) TaxID=1109443 RepID=G4T9I1_SERID|nr:Golgi apyrase; AltName: Full=ATP-diphosphatase; AltName: Full=ATP-diphosphohydrolase; AltName: Full=Adenosine diphosphatase; Short=ADPase; AltName: Full=Golgi nucleoside diphosphatase; AltName: Full=Yeast nucleoside diphosphatase 1 [Serendipita indica DSM 11827]CCA67983.1 related to YND1-apyrase (NDPase/NTPase) [Serendipita indica DSM 11827]
MPPPTQFDPWLASRRFGIVIDAGSSGSRIQLYSWRDARIVQTELSPAGLATLPIVETATKDPEDSIRKIEPGLSTFGTDPEGIFEYLKPLIQHAKAEIPPHLHAETPLFLLATAGMRLLPKPQQDAVLRKVCQYFRDYTTFKVERTSPLGHCGSSVRIISGEEEGLFGWIAVNYLMEAFSNGSKDANTYGFLDMGGASTQIAFEPRDQTSDLTRVRLRLLNGKDITHNVFVATWLGYGTNQARARYVGNLIDTVEEKEGHHDSIIPDPCLPRDLKRAESSTRNKAASPHSHKTHTLVGTGNFTQCLEQSAPLLNKNAPCQDIPCLFGGKKTPTIDFSVSRFVGVSEYWYSSEQIFNLGGAYNFVQYEQAATKFCGQEWRSILAHHEWTKKKGRLGGDGEIEEDGKVVGLGVWGSTVETHRLELQCFKAAWIVNILHEGFGMPRVVDPGGNSTDTSAVNHVDHSAEGKGFKRPLFQSADSIGDTAITWTLGKMVIEASKEIKSTTGDDTPIMDPLQSQPDFDRMPTSQSGLLDYYGRKWSHRLPTSLQGEMMGVPIIVVLIYIAMLAILAFIYLKLKKRLRMTFRRFLRQTGLRIERDDAMEMQYTNGSSYSPISPVAGGSMALSLRRFAASIMSALQPSQRHPRPPSYYPDGDHSDAYPRANGTVSRNPNTFSEARYSESSRGSSPPRSLTGRRPADEIRGAIPAKALYNSLSSLTRTQNSSSSLSLYPRSTASSLLSRSGAQTPVGDS